MNKKRKMKLKMILWLIILSILSFTACNNKYEPVKTSADSTKIVEDKNYTDDLKNEKEVQLGKVYIQNNMAIATIIVKKGVNVEETNALAEKYAKKLKKTYNEMQVNVQAVQSGKNIANIVIK